MFPRNDLPARSIHQFHDRTRARTARRHRCADPRCCRRCTRRHPFRSLDVRSARRMASARPSDSLEETISRADTGRAHFPDDLGWADKRSGTNRPADSSTLLKRRLVDRVAPDSTGRAIQQTTVAHDYAIATLARERASLRHASPLVLAVDEDRRVEIAAGCDRRHAELDLIARPTSRSTDSTESRMLHAILDVAIGATVDVVVARRDERTGS